ncbi:MAG: hypothetical protein CVV44_15040 [Spirochaetae bacterium HGW-Spirochaetae-1]|jgi:hypothetical protein|nr:MAG: hypothetical protein CVV44_15040 [Spirochaetae bacterium HGW-Spirochaetae-1]
MDKTGIIKNDNYSIQFLEKEHRIIFRGTMRLKDHEYRKTINTDLISLSSRLEGFIELDVSQLEYLNSCGIASLSVYLTQMKEFDTSIRIVGSNSISWQVMSLDNFPLCHDRVEIIMQ